VYHVLIEYARSFKGLVSSSLRVSRVERICEGTASACSRKRIPKIGNEPLKLHLNDCNICDLFFLLRVWPQLPSTNHMPGTFPTKNGSQMFHAEHFCKKRSSYLLPARGALILPRRSSPSARSRCGYCSPP